MFEISESLILCVVILLGSVFLLPKMVHAVAAMKLLPLNHEV